MKHLTIYILDDEPLSLNLVSEMIGIGFPGAEINPFTDHRAFLDAPGLCDADLFIIDIHLNDIDGRNLPALMPSACMLKPFLFISGYPVADDDFDSLGALAVFEFISKPFNMRQFIHRIGLLMEACPMKTHPIDDIFDLMMCAPLVVVVIDDAGRVRYCNQQAAVFVGLGAAAEMIGQDWAAFVPEKQAARDWPPDAGRQGDYIGHIITVNNERKKLRWLITPFEGDAGQALKLMIGIPAQMEMAMTDKIRRLWRERIRMDKAAIKALKPMAPAEINTCKLTP